ncbi:MAG: 30S ribosomal protein S9 [Terriglobia bacterium]
MPEAAEYRATGRRKSAIARVYLRTGDGKIIINRRPLEEYVPSKAMQVELQQPLAATEMAGKFDILILLRGGGLHGQVGAARLGIARALMVFNPELRPVLRRGAFLTRDSRIKERKKYGQKGARKRFQFSKR